MKKNLVFIFHGMGNDDATSMKNDYVEPIKKWADKYKFDFPNNFENSVRLVTYNHHFHKIISDWENDFNRLSEILSGFPLNSRELIRIQGGVEKVDNYFGSGETKEFLWTHLGDVILYKYFKEIKSKVVYNCLNSVVKELKKEIDEVGESNLNIIFVAHSLGTAVASDVIDLFYEIYPEELDDYLVDTAHMFANVSHLVRGNSINLSNTNEMYSNSYARPPLGTQVYGCNFFNLYGHKLDIFTLEPYDFEPEWQSYYYDDSLSRLFHINGSITGSVLSKVVNQDFKEEDFIRVGSDFHSFEHYISNPKVLKELIESLGENSISDEELENALKIYEGGEVRGKNLSVENIKDDLLNEMLKKAGERLLEALSKRI